ncbi:MAG: putative Ig domain-containing protein [Candidatus Thermoplasmatota archaeon]|nr:putative Ig domain-containing protein [Candidatus Thermoplasmatota archaeon]
MIGKFGALLLSGFLLVSGLLVIEGDPISGEPTRLAVDDPSYRILPLFENATTLEDEPYKAAYFSTMGNLIVNSFITDADWLSYEYSEALVMDMTDNVGFWSFDQGDAYDASGNNIHGTVHGPTSAVGISDSSMSFQFDGDDHISIPHDPLLNITDEITVEAWIFPTFDDTKEHMIISKGGNWNFEDPQCYELTIDKDRPLFQMKLPRSEDWYGAAPDEPITKNTWHHVAGVYDGTRFNIYIDGVNQTKLYTGWGGDYKGAVYTGGLLTSSHNISIGRREPATWGSLYYKGSIDDVRIWDRAIGEEEMMQHAVIPGTACMEISGTPDNGDVAEHDITINVTDGDGRYAQRRFTLTVENVPPTIMTADVPEVLQDEQYLVQYVSDEVGGDIQWSIVTDASWLSMNASTGTLEGIPSNADVGIVAVTVTVDDGNGGTDSSSFDLEIIDVNDAPMIITDNVLTVKQGSLYHVEYEGIDIDGEALEWSMVTDASWLSMEPHLGILNGTPTNDDVGEHDVTITASDPRGLSDSTEFVLEVIDVNDPPFWTDVPDNDTVMEGATYRYDINASDMDRDDVITYELLTFPQADVVFDTSTGLLEWNATRSIFSDANHTLKFMVKARDKELTITHSFHLDLILNPSPISRLISPSNNTRVSNVTTLSWEGEDADALKYDIYLGRSMQDVISLSDLIRIAHDLDGTEYVISDLEEGQTYYWTAIPKDRYSQGNCTDNVFGFYVNVLPVSDLISPSQGETVPFSNVVLSFHGSDPDDDTLIFHIYLSTDPEDILDLSPSARSIGTSPFKLEDPEPGAIYHWTVIPEDGLDLGTCRKGILQFRVNVPPEIFEVGDVMARVGSELLVHVNGTDDEDLGIDAFSLLEHPMGMTINPELGQIVWTPNEDDIGYHTVVVQLSDGFDSVDTSFMIEVLQAEAGVEPTEPGSSINAMIAILVVVLAIILVAILFMLLLLKRQKDKHSQLHDKEGEVSSPDEGADIPLQEDSTESVEDLPLGKDKDEMEDPEGQVTSAPDQPKEDHVNVESQGEISPQDLEPRKDIM